MATGRKHERTKEEENEPQDDAGEIVGCAADEKMKIWFTYCERCNTDELKPELCPKRSEQGDLEEFVPERETKLQTIIRKVKRWFK